MKIVLTASHVCLGTASIDEVLPALLDMGRVIMFRQEPGPIPPAKRPFVAPECLSQQMLYTHAQNGLGIELLNHYPLRTTPPDDRVGPFLPIYTSSTIPADSRHSSVSGQVGLPLCSSEAYAVKPLIFSKAEASNDCHGIHRIVLNTPNPSHSARFLKDGFGFEERPQGIFTVPSVIRRPLEIQIVETPETTVLDLDSRGWVCLSFEVKSVAHSITQLREGGASEVGQPFFYSAGKRELCVAFVRGPTGELYELLETVKIIR